MDQLPSEILSDIINLLPVKKQLTVKSVNKRFNELALCTTTFLDLYHIPKEHWLKVAEQMPKLRSITGFPSARRNTDIWEKDDILFLQKLAVINQNIVDIIPFRDYAMIPRKVPSTRATAYLKAVKKLDPSYTGSGLNVLFNYLDYKSLLKKYPDLEIKCGLQLGWKGYKDELFLATIAKTADLSHFVKLVLGQKFVWSRLPELLHKTANVTDLVLGILEFDSSFKLYPILEQIAVLPLKKLFLEAFIKGVDEGEPQAQKRSPQENLYQMTGDDYTSLRKVLNIQSLRVVHVSFAFLPDIQNVYDIVIESANNNLDEIEVTFLRVAVWCGKASNHRLYLISRSPPGYDYQHTINVNLLTKFSIVEFMKKFNSSRSRRFRVYCGNDKEWSRIQTEFNAFITSHPSHKYTLSPTRKGSRDYI